MVLNNFFFSWEYCTCFCLRLVGIGVMVLGGREECVLFF